MGLFKEENAILPAGEYQRLQAEIYQEYIHLGETVVALADSSGCKISSLVERLNQMEVELAEMQLPPIHE